MFLKRFIVSFLVMFITIFTFNVSDIHAAMISTKQEIELGSKVAQDLEKKHGLVNDQELQDRINTIGQRLVLVSERKDIKYSFKVLDSEEVNALAVPGGFIYVFKGLVDYMPTEEELAGVLGHEITHVVKKHSVNQMEKNLWTRALTMLAAVISGNSSVANLAPYLGEAIMAGYSRKDERQADDIGFQYLIKANYNPYAMYVAMSKLNDLPDKGSYGIFSSHPDSQDRLRSAKMKADALKISQKVVREGEKYKVVDGTYSFTVGATVDSTKSEYRAYLLAGGLYNVVKQDKNPDADKFISLSFKNRMDIYYDDIYLYSIYNQDISGDEESLDDAANAWIHKFRNWANKR